jgi:hypothetical protein
MPTVKKVTIHIHCLYNNRFDVQYEQYSILKKLFLNL